MVERRAHLRVVFSLPMEWEFHMGDSRQSWESQAVLKNISQGGLYFECETAPPLRCGDVGEFTFTTTPAPHIKTQAVVKRIVPQVAGTSNFGVSVQFISAPLSG